MGDGDDLAGASAAQPDPLSASVGADPAAPRGSGAFRYYLSGDNHSVLGHGDANGTNLARFDYSAGGDFAGEGGIPFHDADGDGDIDLIDFPHFATCIGTTDPECLAIHDSNSDGQINNVDFVQFPTCFSGSGNPPPLTPWSLLVARRSFPAK